ncbi:MAG: TIGR03067 domain-containing protein [Vicinamibacterales bacterium]
MPVVLRALVACALAVTPILAQAPVRRAPADLEGAWIAESMEANGNPMPAAVVQGVRFTFRGEALILTGFGGGPPEQTCTFVIDAQALPHRLDFTTPGGRTVYAVYGLTGDGPERRLTVVFVRNGDRASRPADLTTSPGSNRLKIVLARGPAGSIARFPQIAN